MNVRGAALQSGLAALGLVAAYTTWQREPERAPGEVVVLDVNKGDVKEVRFDDGAGKWVQLDRRNERGLDEPRVWLKLSANDKTKTPERELPGNDGATRLWEKFAPLRATRALGVLKADKLKELGLETAKKKLEITAKGEKHTFLVGTSPFSVSEPYVKDDHDGRVYVLGGGVISDLDSAATRLVERTLHGFKPGEFDALMVASGDKKRDLTAPPSDNPMAAKLVSKKTGKTDDLAKNWHDKLWRSMIIDVLGKGELPKAGAPEVACKVEYQEKGKPKGFIELGRTAAATPPPPANVSMPTPPPPATAQDTWARSEHTAGWVKLPQSADEIIKECAKVAAGE
jgi:hypothetical protein